MKPSKGNRKTERRTGSVAIDDEISTLMAREEESKRRLRVVRAAQDRLHTERIDAPEESANEDPPQFEARDYMLEMIEQLLRSKDEEIEKLEGELKNRDEEIEKLKEGAKNKDEELQKLVKK